MLGLVLNSACAFLFTSPPVNDVYHKMLLNENESYLAIVAKQILLVTINNVYGYKTRNNISFSIHCNNKSSHSSSNPILGVDA